MRELKSDQARRDWRDLLDEMERDPAAAVTILRYDRPVAVLMPAGRRDPERDDSGPDPRRWTDAMLAMAHADYGYGACEAVDAEFWRRNPVLHGFRNAIAYLSSCHALAWQEANGDADILAPDSGYESLPESGALTAAYKESVERIAAPARAAAGR